MKQITTILLLCFLLVCPSITMADEPLRIERSRRTVTIEGRPYFIHSVARRETLFSLAKAYGVSQEEIEKNNPFLGGELRVGMTLLIPEREKESPTPLNVTQKPVEPEHKAFIAPINESVDKPQVNLTDQKNEKAAEEGQSLAMSDRPSNVGPTRKMDLSRGLNVSLLLPIASGRSNDVNFVDFLNGALLGAGRLASEGVKVNIDVHSTKANVDQATALVSSGKLNAADVIIGPVYDEPFEVVGRWATSRHVPIISPLGGSGALNNPYVVCMAPSEATRYDKLRSELSSAAGAVNVIYIECPGKMDFQMDSAIAPFLPASTRRLVYQGKATAIGDLGAMLVRDVKNVVVLAVSDETEVEGLLSRLSSLNTASRFDISVIGTSRWARFANMNLDLFFKLRVSYITSSYGERSSDVGADFTRSYVSAFGSLPNSYSMRGYDAIVVFGSLAFGSGEDMLYDLSAYVPLRLQTPYRFVQVGGTGSRFDNVEWSLVSYFPDYTITVR
ncbi:MAG: LysM peptidoglycan-binding domain-containing protein [Mucinivorans sp.]